MGYKAVATQNLPAEAIHSRPHSSALVAETNAEEGPPVLELAILLARRKWWIARATAVATAAGVALGLLLPVRYTATATIMPPQQVPSTSIMLANDLAGRASGALLTAGGGGLSLRSPNEIYIGLLESRPIADAIIGQFHLMDAYHAHTMAAAEKRLKANAAIVSGRSSLISIAVTDRDKNRAADIANAYVSGLDNLTKDVAVSEAGRRVLFFEDQIKQARDNLVKAELTFQQVQQNKGVVQLDAQSKVIIGNLGELHAKVVAKQIELQTLESYSTEKNPDVQLAERELAAMEEAQERMKQGDRAASSQGFELGALPGAGSAYLIAEHELAFRQTIFDVLMKQYEAAKMDEARNATIVQVVQRATPPELKSQPPRAKIVLVFAFLGFLFSAAWVCAGKRLESNPALTRRIAALRSALLSR
jgi:uncharacterized protein involved in exopolysaccharide biosynthesis